ncbi:hypothetical protein GCM10010145_28240 [Streptomyces ruber]|uniref:Sortase n=2 Tax=Streptomyces TaxID=1883 RepID=A0A918EQM2_9ACTN|nr:hypothetical protein [Streptomyces ruber]GGQ56548.1 hypothetical protein GCM10010145_28240 [Streptomyces ruber]
MRHTARLPVSAALAVIATGLAAAPAYGAAAGADPAGKVTVYPSGVVPGAEVTVGTAACGPDGAATGDASAVGAGTFPLVPGARGEDAAGRFKVPPSAQPGTYEIVVRCSGRGRKAARATGDLVVALTPRAHDTPGRTQTHPRGSVKTGVGGALGPDPVQTAAGVTALAVAAAGGTWLLHRRARGDGI